MVRLIKRYESRKLYDTEESRYVSLDEIATFVRRGQQIRVIDNSSQEDVTAQMLTQVILEEGRNGKSPVSTEFLHDLLRAGERALHSGVQQVQHGVDRILEVSMDRISPVKQARQEMGHLRDRLEELESSLARLEVADRDKSQSRSTAAPKKTKAKPRKTRAKAKAKTKTKKKSASTRKRRTKKP